MRVHPTGLPLLPLLTTSPRSLLGNGLLSLQVFSLSDPMEPSQ